MKPYIIGITGGTASGKTFIVSALKERFDGRIAFLSQDQYYKTEAAENLTRWERANVDRPSAFDNNLLVVHLKNLKNGETVQAPTYDYILYKRLKAKQSIFPRPIIILEGIMLFCSPALRKTVDLKIFLDADADIRLGRRLLRDIEERGISVDNLKKVITWYMNIVKPMYDKYILPNKQYADLVLNTNEGSFQAAEKISKIIEDKLKGS